MTAVAYLTFLFSLTTTGFAFKPYFVGKVSNITAQRGHDTSLTCSVENLGAYKVAWVRVETQTILTIHHTVITRNPRIRLDSQRKGTWTLSVNNVTESDRGYYMCQINSDPMIFQKGFLEVVVPPVIFDSGSSSDMVAREGVNVKLRCQASGYPVPTVQWRREDGAFIHRAQASSGEVLTITRVSRLHMGAYLCIARNGILPAVSKRVYLHVHFAPVVLVSSQLESGYIGQEKKILECKTEAYPRSINYWTNEHGELITPNEKYETEVTERGVYSTAMKLLIKDIRPSDFQKYKCVAKNSIGEVDGFIHFNEVDEDWTDTTKQMPEKQPKKRLKVHQKQSYDILKKEADGVGNEVQVSLNDRQPSGTARISPPITQMILLMLFVVSV